MFESMQYKYILKSAKYMKCYKIISDLKIKQALDDKKMSSKCEYT